MVSFPFLMISSQSHYGRRALVQDLRLVGSPAVWVQNDAYGVGVVVKVLEGQMRVVRDDRSHAHEYGVVLPAQVLRTGFVLVGRYGHLGAVASGDLPIRRHGAVDMHERPHSLAPGVTLNL